MISSELRSQIAAILEALEIGDELYWQPSRQAIPGAWTGHLAIAFWLIKAARPTMFVELGTHSGNSYSAFCQAIAQMGLPTRAFAVDTWLGDEHSGLYGEEVFRALQAFNESHFGAFSKLLRTTFDEARSYFADNSIDLLHIDGLHTYEAVKRDFETWRSALSPSSVVVFHDTNVRERDFGVWKLWQELAAIYPSFEFHHSEGLGVLGVGPDQPPLIRRLFELDRDPQSSAVVRRIFAARGEVFVRRSQVLDLTDRFGALSSDFQNQLHRVATLEQDVACRDATLNERLQELSKNRESIRDLQQELVGRDATLRDQDDEVRRTKTVVQQQESAIASKERTIGELNENAARLQAQLAEVRQKLGLIENSTAWKLASRISSAFERYPTFRLYARRLARLLWWTVTFQLVDRLRARRRLFETRDLIAKSSLFDRDWYVAQYAGIAEAGCDPALHYALYGATERRNPGPRFDAEVYLLRYPDVAEAGMNPLIHYLEHGAGEGRVITSVRKSSPSNDYQSWVECYDTIRDEDRAAITRHIGLLRDRPLFSVVMPVYNTRPTFLRKALDSIRAQLYPDWELCIADDASSNPDVRAILNDYARRDRRIQLVCRNENGHISAASNSALELATGAFIVLMDHDDELSEHALYMVALTLNEYPESDIIYSDEDKLDDEGRRHGPYFKTDWNPELFYSQNMISHLGVYRASLVRQVGGFREGYEGSQDYDLALRVLAQSTYNRFRHIPHVLYHWRIGDGLQTYSTANMPVAVQAARRALTDYFAS